VSKHRTSQIVLPPEAPPSNGRAGLPLARERQQAILDLLGRNGSLRVALLAPEFGVTQETIRRDLEVLGEEGRLLRTHGGALPLARDRNELPLNVRETRRLNQKRAIARHAARQVVEGDVLALDASSTVCELARVLPDIPLTVVTNSLAAAGVLHDRSRVRVIITGGLLDGPSFSLIGDAAIGTLDRFHFTKAFVSCQSIDLDRGLGVTADEQAGIKRRMIALAEHSVLLADSSKFGAKAVEYFAKLSDVDAIVTDPGIPAHTRRKLIAAGLSVEIAGNSRSTK
jgi:DeoR/GlpR family transcriptional regulator of sugar metabolism